MDAGTVSIQRTIGMVRNKGEGAQIVEKVPKTKRSRRVIDLGPGTLAVLSRRHGAHLPRDGR